MMMRGIGKLAGASLQFTATPARYAGNQWTGDSYRLDITGAAPGSPVLQRRTGPAGSLQRDAGTTDANGNFSESGVFTRENVGTWLDYWYVGDELVGYYQLTVFNAPPGSDILASIPQTPSTTPLPPAPIPTLPTPNPTAGTWAEQILEGTTPAQIATYNAANTPAPAPIVTTGGAQPNPTPPVTAPPPSTGELIPGVSNTYLLAGVGGVLLLLAMRR